MRCCYCNERLVEGDPVSHLGEKVAHRDRHACVAAIKHHQGKLRDLMVEHFDEIAHGNHCPWRRGGHCNCYVDEIRKAIG